MELHTVYDDNHYSVTCNRIASEFCCIVFSDQGSPHARDFAQSVSDMGSLVYVITVKGGRRFGDGEFLRLLQGLLDRARETYGCRSFSACGEGEGATGALAATHFVRLITRAVAISPKVGMAVDLPFSNMPRDTFILTGQQEEEAIDHFRNKGLKVTVFDAEAKDMVTFLEYNQPSAYKKLMRMLAFRDAVTFDLSAAQ